MVYSTKREERKSTIYADNARESVARGGGSSPARFINGRCFAPAGVGEGTAIRTLTGECSEVLVKEQVGC